jgi:hypothetical protein
MTPYQERNMYLKMISRLIGTIQLRPGEVMVLHGPTACGKTTVAMCLLPGAGFATDMHARAVHEYRSRLGLPLTSTIIEVSKDTWDVWFPDCDLPLVVDLESVHKLPAVCAYAAAKKVPCIVCMNTIDPVRVPAAHVVVRLTSDGFIVEKNRSGPCFAVKLVVTEEP